MFKPNAVTLHDGHDNFFTPLRILMALAVLVGHAMMVKAGDPTAEPKVFYIYTMSYLAVNAFFIASGYLVTKSMFYRKQLSSFAAARILRIMPALAVHVILVTFSIGLIVTSLPLLDYLTHKDVLSQPFKVLTFYETEIFLPGVFQNNPEQHGSATLWTLRYEAIAYVATAILFSIGLMKHRSFIFAQFLATAAIYAISARTGLLDNMPSTIQMLVRFMLPYSLGAAIFAYQDKIKLYWPAIPALIGVTALCHNLPEMEILVNLSLAYALFWLAYVRVPSLTRLQKLTDISYGIYIYHWVILQLHLTYTPESSVITIALSTMILSTLIALASWHIVEKPALGMKDQLARILTLNFHKSAAAAE